MNYMEQVAKMLGVELGEEFAVDRTFYCGTYTLTEMAGLWCKSESGDNIFCPTLLSLLLGGKYNIIKKPWKPKSGESFFFVGVDKEIWSETYQDGFSAEMMYVRVGNCYRSQKEITPELVEKWVAWYKGGECPVKDG